MPSRRLILTYDSIIPILFQQRRRLEPCFSSARAEADKRMSSIGNLPAQDMYSYQQAEIIYVSRFGLGFSGGCQVCHMIDIQQRWLCVVLFGRHESSDAADDESRLSDHHVAEPSNLLVSSVSFWRECFLRVSDPPLTRPCIPGSHPLCPRNQFFDAPPSRLHSRLEDG